jgi:hypothetical protein
MGAKLQSNRQKFTHYTKFDHWDIFLQNAFFLASNPDPSLLWHEMARSTGTLITVLVVVSNAITCAHALTPSKECLRSGGNIETCLRGVASDPVAESVVSSFKEAFGTDPAAVFLAPGRVNLVSICVSVYRWNYNKRNNVYLDPIHLD